MLKSLDDSHFIQGRNDKWFHQFKKIFKLIYNMEKGKYLEPKYAMTLFPLMKFLFEKYAKNTSSGSQSIFSYSN